MQGETAMLPSVLARQLQSALADYVDTTFPITNPVFKDSIRRTVQETRKFFHEPYVAVRLPFRVSDQDRDLFQAIQPEYPPYVHQQRAFERMDGEAGRPSLGATGAGYGNTEGYGHHVLANRYHP